MITYQGKIFDEERALYNIRNATVRDCTFAGPADNFGEIIFDSTLYPCKGKVIKR